MHNAELIEHPRIIFLKSMFTNSYNRVLDINVS